MIVKSEGTLKNKIFTGPALVAALVCVVSLTGAFLESSFFPGASTARARIQYGILGRQAPELDLTNWIDGDGKKTEQIMLSNCRGKVIYLYFFQDW
jgi:hypothetical protein